MHFLSAQNALLLLAVTAGARPLNPEEDGHQKLAIREHYDAIITPENLSGWDSTRVPSKLKAREHWDAIITPESFSDEPELAESHKLETRKVWTRMSTAAAYLVTAMDAFRQLNSWEQRAIRTRAEFEEIANEVFAAFADVVSYQDWLSAIGEYGRNHNYRFYFPAADEVQQAISVLPAGAV